MFLVNDNFLKLKHSCLLIIRLKTIKYFEELYYYLSFILVSSF